MAIIKEIQMNQAQSQLFKMIEDALPDPLNQIGGYFTEKVNMRDGVRLLTNIYVPSEGHSWPCLVMRTPYPQAIEMLTTMSLPLVQQGYVLVVQGCRGTCGSEGLWEAFDNEREDGIDTLNWVAEQVWQNGNIATFGNSYQAYTQWIIADSLPEEVKTMYIENFGVDRYRQMYMNGMFRHDIYTSWALNFCGITTDRPIGELYEEALKIKPHNQMDVELLGESLPFYQNYISKSYRSDSYWKDGIWELLRHIPARIDIPICVVAGWFDHHLDGTLLGYRSLNDEIRKKSRLVVGPWDHGSGTPGELNYPMANKFGPAKIKLALEWFDSKLKNKSESKELSSEVYIIGNNRWQTLEKWPPQSQRIIYYFTEKGELTIKPNTGDISFTYDPSNPIKTHGGGALLAWASNIGNTPHGARLQPDYSDRNDVLAFVSNKLDAPIIIAGQIKVKLMVSSSAADTCFTIKVCEEFEDGRVFNIVDGATSILLRNGAEGKQDYLANERVELKIDMWDTAWQLSKGSRIRVYISSSNFPAYHVHSNTDKLWSSVSDSQLATQTVYFGIEESVIEIPIMSE